MNLRKSLSTLRRKLWKKSRPSLNDIDGKLQKYLDFDNGFFLEAGANDGYSQSNTYYLEKSRGWSGILVEGIPELYGQCVQERANSKVVQAALVDAEYNKPSVKMHYAGLMSVVDLSLKDEHLQAAHLRKGLELQHLDETYTIEVTAVTLESILDEQLEGRCIDFFSLDVEGYELNVLKGTNLDKHRPKFLLVEARYFEEVDEYLRSFKYQLIEQLSHHDYLYTDR